MSQQQKGLHIPYNTLQIQLFKLSSLITTVGSDDI